MKEMYFRGIAVNQRRSLPMVVLKDANDEDTVPIYTGHAEAEAIALAACKHQSARPSTHEFLFGVLSALGNEPISLEITAIEDGTYFAHLVIKSKKGARERKIDCRPSDGIVIALRYNVPIFVAPGVIAKAKASQTTKLLPKPQAETTDDTAFMAFLQNLKASDFPKPG